MAALISLTLETVVNVHWGVVTDVRDPTLPLGHQGSFEGESANQGPAQPSEVGELKALDRWGLISYLLTLILNKLKVEIVPKLSRKNCLTVYHKRRRETKPSIQFLRVLKLSVMKKQPNSFLFTPVQPSHTYGKIPVKHAFSLLGASLPLHVKLFQ